MRPLIRFVPGLVLAAGLILLANWLGGVLGELVLHAQGIPPEGRASPISMIMVAIVLGMVVANVVTLPKAFAPGLALGLKKILRLWIILVGVKLSFFDVIKLGAYGVPVVVLLIAAVLLISHLLAKRLGVTDRLATLAAASTAICGVTATVAVAPTIDADDNAAAYTIANVPLFGMLAL